MNPYVIERLIEERRHALVRLASDGEAGPWRRATGRALVAAGLRLGAPARARGAAFAHARRLVDEGDLAPRLVEPAGAC